MCDIFVCCYARARNAILLLSIDSFVNVFYLFFLGNFFPFPSDERSKLKELLVRVHALAITGGIYASVSDAVAKLVVRTLSVAFDFLFPNQR